MNNKYSDYVYAKQFDKKREIHWYITENGEPKQVGEMFATFAMKTPNGQAVYGAPVKSNDNKYFKMELAATHTAVPGKIPYQLIITDTQLTKNPDQTWNWDVVNKVIGTITSFLIVEPCPVDEDDIEYEYSSLSNEIIQRLTAAGEIYNDANLLWNDLKMYSQIVVSDTEPAQKTAGNDDRTIVSIGQNDFWVKPY